MHMKSISSLKRLAGAFLFAALTGPFAFGQISFNGTTYTENFNGLGFVTSNAVFSGTVGAQATIPNLATWSGAKWAGSSAGNATINFIADTGAGNGGAVYSYGSSNSTERALGVIASGTNMFAIGTAFTNTSNQTITSLTIRYTGEYWRSSTAQQNTLTFAYGVSTGPSATSATLSNYLTNNTLTAVSGLDLVGPGPVSSNGPLNGNVVPNRKKVSFLLENIVWEANSTLFIRWTDIDNGGNDAGLAVDDFSLIQGVFSDPDDVPIGTTDALFTPALFGGDAFGPTKNAVFDKTGSVVNLTGVVAAKGLKFNTNGYTLASPTTSDSLSLSTGEVFVSTGISATISGNLTGSTGLEKTGLGTLVLSGPKSFGGNVTISEGRLEISDDSALGSLSNSITFGGTLATSGNFSFSSGRTLSGFGTLESASGGSLTFAGPLTNASLTITGPSTVAVNAATNSIGTLIFSQPVALSIATGNLTVSSGLTFSQSSGNSTISGGLNFGAGGNTLSLANGNLTPLGTMTGNMSGTNRISKTGLGTLQMTSTTLTGPTGFRIGLQGGFPDDGGKVVVDQVSDLGTLQTLFNSGTLEATNALSFPVGLSIGGRLGSTVSIATLAGGNMTFSGNSSFFNASGAAGSIGLNVTNNTVFSGNFTATTPATVGTPIPTAVLVNLTGNGSLTFSGNASTVLDNLYLTGGINLVIASTGTLGGEQLNVDSGATVSGSGVFSGYRVFPSGSGNTTIAETYRPSTATFYSGGTLAPSGALKFRSNLTLESGSSTILDINGPVIGSGYDSVDVSLPGGNSTITAYTLTTGGTLTLNVAAPATSGNYTLFTTGAGVSRSGSFSSVTLTGGYSGTLAGNATTTSGNRTFTFEQSTGVLTVADNAPPISSNANLSAFSLTGVTLSPSFDPAVTSYTATVANAVNNVTVLATVQQVNAVARFSSIIVPPGGLGIPVVVGSNSIPVVVTAQDGTTTKTYTVTVTRSPSALEAWRTLNFPGSTATSGDGRNDFDFDGDGVVNLLEYATGTDAKIANASPVTVAQPGNFLTLTYPVIADASLTYTVQGTSDLTTAFTAGAGATTGTTVKTYTDTVDLSAPGARRFLRLQVTATVAP